jgi:heme/copper-type cytochrome/quinol oxidase subunit 3
VKNAIRNIGHASLHAEVRSVAAILLLSSSVIVAVGKQQGLPFDWAGRARWLLLDFPVSVIFLGHHQ